jgi:tetratricopeptide (TPR) repeat protein
MTLTFRDSVFVPSLLTTALWMFAAALSAFVAVICFKLSKASAMGILVPLMLLEHKYDLLGQKRMRGEKALSVSSIDFEPESLLIIGHTGFEHRYSRKGMRVSKEARPRRLGWTSYYLVIHLFGKKSAAFFISYNEKEVDKAIAAFEATAAANAVPHGDRVSSSDGHSDGKAASAEQKKAQPSGLQETLATTDAASSVAQGEQRPSSDGYSDGNVASEEQKKAQPSGMRETFFPLPTNTGAVLLVSAAAALLTAACVGALLDFFETKSLSPADLIIGGFWLFMIAIAILLIKERMTQATAIWITETCLRVRYANGKTAEYPYDRYGFAKQWQGRISSQDATLYLEIWQDLKRIERFELGDNTGEEAALETVCRRLFAAQKRATKGKGPEGRGFGDDSIKSVSFDSAYVEVRRLDGKKSEYSYDSYEFVRETDEYIEVRQDRKCIDRFRLDDDSFRWLRGFQKRYSRRPLSIWKARLILLTLVIIGIVGYGVFSLFERPPVRHEHESAERQQKAALPVPHRQGMHGQESVEWYQKAADQGTADAQFNLGLMYAQGHGVLKNDSKAVEWWQKAADQGDANAQCGLGVMYAEGHGVPKDHGKAVEWFQKAADHGNASAQNNLGTMFAEGYGLPKDDSKAVEWFQKAADHGSVSAQNNLGTMYEKGRGVSKDYHKAIEWYRKAAEHDFKPALKALERLRHDEGRWSADQSGN